MFSDDLKAQKEIWSTFGEHTKSQFTYRPLDFTGFANAYPGKVSVDAFGDFSFSVPLFEVPARKLSYPLGLNNRPGIKVTQEASWVGLGWSFSDSYVERKVDGLMDSDVPAIDSIVVKLDTNKYDTVANNGDQYFIKLPDGRTATINQHNLPDSPENNHMEFVIEDGKGWKVEYQKSGYNRFIITDESGVQYVFSDGMLGYYYDRGIFKLACTNSGQAAQRYVHPPLNQPFVKWHLTAILHPDYSDNDTSSDLLNPLDNTPSNTPTGSWIAIINKFSDTVTKDWRYYTMRQMANTDLDDCSLNGGDDGSTLAKAFWTPSRFYQLTYPKYIVTPTHVTEFITEDEPYNPIADLMEDKYGVFDEFPPIDNNSDSIYTSSWEYFTDFHIEETDRGEKGRRLTGIKVYKNTQTPRNSTPSTLTDAFFEIEFDYYAPGEAFWSSGGVSFYEERSLLKSTTIKGAEEQLVYSFKYHNVLTSGDVQSVSINGTNRNILKCFKSSYQPNQNCNYYSGATNYPNKSHDDLSSPLLNYYRGAYNAATNSSIGSDGYLNRNSTLQNSYNNNVTDFSSLEDDAAMWSLKKVTFPNGSTQEFEYQSDRYVVDFYHKGKDITASTFGPTTSKINWGFGLRLKTQTITGGTGGAKVYSYEYASLDEHTNSPTDTWWDGVTNGGDIDEGVGRIYADPIEIRTPSNCSDVIDPFQCRQEHIPPTDYLSNQTERRVVYGRITENQPDGSSIVTYYDVATLDENRGPLPSSNADKFDEIMGKRGLVNKIEYYNNSDQLVYTNQRTTTEQLQTGITDQFDTGKYFTYWTSSIDETSTTKYLNADITSSTFKSFIEESGLVRKEEVDDPAGNTNKKYVTSYTYQYESDTDFENANRLTEPDQVTQKTVLSGVDTELNITKYNYNSAKWLESVTSGYSLGNEITPIQNILYDSESMLFEFEDSRATKYAVHYTTESKLPSAIFSNAQYSETFFEDFEDGNYTSIYRSDASSLGSWQVVNSSWGVEDGRLQHKNGSGYIWEYFPGSILGSSYVIEYDVYPNPSGIHSEFRFAMDGSQTIYYKVLVRNTESGSSDIKLYRTSSLKGTASLSGIIDSYKDPIRVRLIKDGNDIQVIVNGETVLNYTDSSVYTGGGIAFYASSSNSKQFFDNIRIYPLEAIVASQSLEDRFLKIKELSDINGVKSYYLYNDLGALNLSLDNREAIQGQSYFSVSSNESAESLYLDETPIKKGSVIGFWSFNESIDGYYGFDTKIEGSGIIQNGAVSNNPSYTFTESRMINSVFNSSDEFGAYPFLFNYGDLDSFDTPGKFTFSGWFYRTPHEWYMANQPMLVTSEGIHNILVANSSTGTSNPNSFQLGTNGSNVEVYLNTVTGGASKQTVNAGIQDNKWYHIALSYDGSDENFTSNLYVDGELIKTWNSNTWYGNLVTTNSPFTIGGANPTSPDGLYNGYVDDFILFSEVLDASEIKALMSGAVSTVTVTDDLGQVRTETTKGRKGSEGFSELKITHDYDIAGRKVSTTRPNSTEKVSTTYHQDPLSRVHEIKQPATGATVPTSALTYNSNTSSELFTTYGNYTAGKLHKVITDDPNGNKSIEYTNTLGHTIASVVDMDNNGTKSSDDLVTEYGYDDLGNLTKVKDPRGLVTEFEYDNLSRLTRKKLPDQTGWVDFKYDKNGNVRFVQTAEHKLSGSSGSQSLNSWSGQPLSKSLAVTKSGLIEFDFTIVDLFFSGYDINIRDVNNGSASIFKHSIPGDINNLKKAISVSSGTYEFYGKSQDPQDQYHSIVGSYTFSPYKYSYTKYDELNRIIETGEYYGNTLFGNADPDNQSFPTSDNRKLIEYKYGYDGAYSGARYLAGNISQIIYYNPNDFTQSPSKTYFSYNEDGLVEWVVQQLRRDDGVLLSRTIEYEYDNIGNLIEIRFDPGGSDSFYQRYTYDGLSRVTKAETSLTGNSGEWLTSAEYTYKSDGLVEQTVLGENAQTIDYTYDERGWLKGINNTSSVGSGPQEDRFFQSIDYFSTSVPSSKRQYNGNIAMQTWGFDLNLINKPDQTYTYTYDNANRLTYADRSGSGYTANAFDVGTLTYDANGNLNRIFRRNHNGGFLDTGFYGDIEIDRETTSNRISIITEWQLPYQFDVDYDANGNLIKNELHNLKKTTFDLANMPIRSISNSGVVQYRYGPDGQRVAKSVLGGTGTLYIRGVGGETLAVYDKNGNLLFHNLVVGSEIIGKTN